MPIQGEKPTERQDNGSWSEEKETQTSFNFTFQSREKPKQAHFGFRPKISHCKNTKQRPLTNTITTTLCQKNISAVLMNKLHLPIAWHNRFSAWGGRCSGLIGVTTEGTCWVLSNYTGWHGGAGGGCDGHLCCHRLNYHQESDNCISRTAIWIITSTRGEIKKPLRETRLGTGPHTEFQIRCWYSKSRNPFTLLY